MTSRIESITAATRDLLNEAPEGVYTGPFADWQSLRPAVARHMPSYDRSELSDVTVVVSADPESSHSLRSDDTMDRCCSDPWQYRLYVVTSKLAETTDENLEEASGSAEIDGLKELSECISRYIWDSSIIVDGETMRVASMEFGPFFDREQWLSSRVFISVLSVTWQ